MSVRNVNGNPCDTQKSPVPLCNPMSRYRGFSGGSLQLHHQMITLVSLPTEINVSLHSISPRTLCSFLELLHEPSLDLTDCFTHGKTFSKQLLSETAVLVSGQLSLRPREPQAQQRHHLRAITAKTTHNPHSAASEVLGRQP